MCSVCSVCVYVLEGGESGMCGESRGELSYSETIPFIKNYMFRQTSGSTRGKNRFGRLGRKRCV